MARILEEIGFPGDISDYESGQRLVSYYVAPVEIPAPVLKEHAAAKLPHQVVPSQFVRLDSIPLTANGKVDKSALPRPGAQQRSLDTVFVAPSGDVETRLVEIWEDVLGVTAIGTRDNFFDLGGDSIMAIQIVTRANRDGLDLTLEQLFEGLTVASVAALMDSSDGEDVGASRQDGAQVSSQELDQLAAVLRSMDTGS